jgi:hypothetical protein
VILIHDPHRSPHAPESARFGLHGAIVAGAGALRLPVRLSADGYAVVLEDETTDRLTGKPGSVASLTLKDPKAFRLLGRRMPRLDTPAKTDGSATFGVDVRLPGLRYACLVRPPVLGATLVSFDDNAARRMPGVSQVFRVEEAVAVVAANTWSAMRGGAAITATWSDSPHATLTTGQIHEQLRVTLIYVTHDQVEALTLADQVVVMNEGRVVQQGTPQELFERPADTFVGYFIGSPGMNLLPCTVEESAAVVEGQRIPLDPAACARARAAAGELLLGVRPELLRWAKAGAPSAVRVEITQVEDLGHRRIATARLGQRTLKVELPEAQPAAPGDVRWIEFPPDRTALYAGGRAV